MVRETDPERVAMLSERFCDVCLVEKEVWTEIFMPRQSPQGIILTNVQDIYDVVIEDPAIEDALDAAIPFGKAALQAAIRDAGDRIRFHKRS